MDEAFVQSRLSRISTMWNLLNRAPGSAPGPADSDASALIRRYQGAAYRYLLGGLRDADAADELFQEFVLRFLQGAFRGANPERGRFRDYLRTTLSHLIVDYQKRRRKSPLPLDLEAAEPSAPEADVTEEQRRFLESWRDDLLSRAWAGLAEGEGTQGLAGLAFRG
jgi:RNA polymerase sigma factor (sigma-70 family)